MKNKGRLQDRWRPRHWPASGTASEDVAFGDLVIRDTALMHHRDVTGGLHDAAGPAQAHLAGIGNGKTRMLGRRRGSCASPPIRDRAAGSW